MGRRKKQEAEVEEGQGLDPRVKKAMLLILIFVSLIMLVLGLFGLAGPLGKFLDGMMAALFGSVRFIAVVIITLVGLNIAFPERKFLRPAKFFGWLVLLLVAAGTVQTWTLRGAQQTSTNAGGYAGSMMHNAFSFVFGEFAIWIVLAALFLVALLLLLGISVVDVAKNAVNFVKSLTVPRLGKDRVMANEDESAEECVEELKPEEEEEEEESEEGEEEEETSEKPKGPAPVVHMPDGGEEEDEKKEEKSAKNGALVRPKERRSIEISVELLDGTPSKPMSGDIQANIEIIERTLKNFGIEVTMGDVAVGPTMTQYTFKPADGIKLTRITALENDLALALAAHPLRIEAPIPGKSLVGIEVPNKAVATVRLKDILGSKTFDEHPSPLAFGLGKDVSGKPWVIPLEKTPHLLVAGATGSGKSVCLNTLLLSLMYKSGPDDLKFILVDPKRVELSLYNGIPYLLTPVITDTQKTVNALKWAVQEMERRYEKLAAFGVRDIKTYNERAEDGMPYLVIVIDELADLMATAAQDVEGSIVRLAQMARAVGIHLVLATQRPSVNVITGLIKANIPGRIAFAVASAIDSRTILDGPGAEKLLGKGDMLLSTSDMAKPKRLQGAFVGDEEIRRVCTFLKNTCTEPPSYDNSVVERQRGASFAGGGGIDDGGGDGDDGDPLVDDAIRILLQAGKASASLLQRRLKVGYSRAARLLDILEEKGVIGPADGAKPREILIKNAPGGSTPPLAMHAEEGDEVPEEETEEEKMV